MRFFHRARALLVLMALALPLSIVAADHADARRGGSFGSRGMRTWTAPKVTPTAPRPAAPVERSMTPRTQQQDSTGSIRNPGVQRPGFFNGIGGGLLGGLLLGGLFGMMMGTGFGGAAGMLGLVFQMLLIGGGLLLLVRFLGRRKSGPAYAGPTGRVYDTPLRDSIDVPPMRSAGSTASAGYGAAGSGGGAADEIGITAADFDTFERKLGEIQGAYAAEDYDRIRALTTPEIAAYFSEELGRNASRGLKNDVSGVKLLQGDLAEAWREGAQDYATVAMRYESVDVTRERATGRVVDGDPDRATESTELWTFVRRPGGDWLLSAIQT